MLAGRFHDGQGYSRAGDPPGSPYEPPFTIPGQEASLPVLGLGLALAPWHGSAAGLRGPGERVRQAQTYQVLVIVCSSPSVIGIVQPTPTVDGTGRGPLNGSAEPVGGLRGQGQRPGRLTGPGGAVGRVAVSVFFRNSAKKAKATT